MLRYSATVIATVASIALAANVLQSACSNSRTAFVSISSPVAAGAQLIRVGSNVAPTAAAFREPQSNFAGRTNSSNGSSFFSMLVAVAGCAVAARSLIVRGPRKHDQWTEVWNRKKQYTKRHPPPALKKKDLNLRVMKINRFRQLDQFWAEFYIFNDPRAEKYQWSVDRVRQWRDEQNTSDDYKKKKLTSREDLSLPLGPTDLKLSGLAKLTGSTTRQLADAKKLEQAKDKSKSAEGDQKGKKKGQGGVDLTNIDSEFMSFKGLVLSKKQKAAMAARAAKQAEKAKQAAGGKRMRKNP